MDDAAKASKRDRDSGLRRPRVGDGGQSGTQFAFRTTGWTDTIGDPDPISDDVRGVVDAVGFADGYCRPAGMTGSSRWDFPKWISWVTVCMKGSM